MSLLNPIIHRQIRNHGRTGRRNPVLRKAAALRCLTAAFLFTSCVLSGCAGNTEAAESSTAAADAGQESPAVIFPHYELKTSVVSEGKEALRVQQADENGFLVILNRKTGEEIPEELQEDPDFVNDGRYEIYEDELLTVQPDGKRQKLRHYRQLAAPEDTEDRKEYFSQTRIRAVRRLQDGTLASVESSFESWQNATGTPRYQTSSCYYLRILKETGEEISTSLLETENNGQGPDFTQLVALDENVLAVPQGNAVLFFGTDGKRQFTVETPFPVSELCEAGANSLAVILKQGGQCWLSLVDAAARSVTVPVELPPDVHSFSRGVEENSLCCLRRSEIFTVDVQSCILRKLVSLYSLDVNPSTLGAYALIPGGKLMLLTNAWNPEPEAVETVVITATPSEKNPDPSPDATASPDSAQTVLTLGFRNMSDRLEELLIAFNRSQKAIRIEALDYGNLTEDQLVEDCPDLTVMDDALYRRLAGERKLADISAMLAQDPEFGGAAVPESIRISLSEEDGSLRRLAGVFRLETMACDADTVDGRTELAMEDLRELLRDMPAGSSLYEPYYTYDRLLNALTAVNRRELVADGHQNATLYARLQTFSGLQPQRYDYSSYAANTASMESRIYEGRLLLLQAHIGSLQELKWYDAFFPSEACFVGWPTETGSRSIFCFDEQLGIASHCGPEKLEAAWQFLRCLLQENYCRDSYGFPVNTALLTRLLDEDAAAVSYRVDEDGEFELDDEGEKIERPRSSWYSPEWRRHYEYSLTDAQREKLMVMMNHAV